MSKFVPLRKFIFDRLYHPQGGYFCKKDFQVGQLASPIDFKKLIGFDDYQEQLYNKYPKNAWLTPSQIFKPYYGMSIGNYIKQAQQKYDPKKVKKQPIRIVEVGAGTGSAAESILFYFQNYSQEQLKNIEYNIVEISPILCSHIETKLKKSFPYLMEKGQIKIHNKDINTYKNSNNCYLIFLQVLDNLPHDKVIKQNSDSYNKYSIVNLQTKQQKYESIEKDRLIKQCLQLYEKYEKIGQKVNNPKPSLLDRIAQKIVNKYYEPPASKHELFLPTGFLSLLKTLSSSVPKSHMIISDFDKLISSIPGTNAPIVSHKKQKSPEKKDFSSYLIDRGQADIFFPINFDLAKYIYQSIMAREALTIKSWQFFDEFQIEGWTNSKSGFNPLKEDFSNTSFLITKV